MNRELEKYLKEMAAEEALSGKDINDCTDVFDKIKWMNLGAHHNSRVTDKKIKQFYEESFERVREAYDDFVETYSDRYEGFEEHLADYGDKRIFSERNMSNLKRYWGYHYSGRKLDNLVADIVKVRGVYFGFIHPSLNELCSYFGTYYMKYKRHFEKL